MKGNLKIKRTPKNLIVIAAILGLAGFGVVAMTIFGYQYLNMLTIGGPGTETSTTTFSTISSLDGEDTSNFVELTIWVPKSDADFDDFEDVLTMSSFEEEITAKKADTISIDISSYNYIWIEVNPNGETPFSNNFHLYVGGTNGKRTIYVYHLTSDVNFNALNRDTLDEITLGDYATDANITIFMDCPHHTESSIHANDGSKWVADEDDWDDMTASEKEEYYDEKNWRCQAPLYDPSVDLEKDYDDDLEKLTNAFALELDFNTTVSTVDGNSAQINLTLSDEDEPFEIVTSGDLIYLIAYEVISFKNGPYDLGLEIEFGADIHLDDIDSGRIIVPRDDDSLGAFTKYSDIAA